MIILDDKIHLEPCPYCGGRAYIDVLFDKPYINAHHSKKCKMRPDTWLLSSEPLKKQIKAWNKRVGENGKKEHKD